MVDLAGGAGGGRVRRRDERGSDPPNLLVDVVAAQVACERQIGVRSSEEAADELCTKESSHERDGTLVKRDWAWPGSGGRGGRIGTPSWRLSGGRYLQRVGEQLEFAVEPQRESRERCVGASGEEAEWEELWHLRHSLGAERCVSTAGIEGVQP